MRQFILVLGIICIFTFFGCGQGKESKQAAQSETKEADEAVMQMLRSNDDFLMFSNSQKDQVNLVYRRKDGNYGWIEPDFE